MNGGSFLTRITASERISAIEGGGCSNPCVRWSVAHWSRIARHTGGSEVPVGLVKGGQLEVEVARVDN